jgi:hypothetical protein
MSMPETQVEGAHYQETQNLSLLIRALERHAEDLRDAYGRDDFEQIVTSAQTVRDIAYDIGTVAGSRIES